ncbi:unnamed protein product [Sphagnum compactum]
MCGRPHRITLLDSWVGVEINTEQPSLPPKSMEEKVDCSLVFSHEVKAKDVGNIKSRLSTELLQDRKQNTEMQRLSKMQQEVNHTEFGEAEARTEEEMSGLHRKGSKWNKKAGKAMTKRFHAVMGPASLSGRGQWTYIQQRKGQMGGWILKEQENLKAKKKMYAAFEEQVDEGMRSCSLYNL